MSDTTQQEDILPWVIDSCRSLGLEVGGADDDFFDAGGNSLTAMRLIARAEEKFGEDVLPPDDLFEHSSVREIASCLAKHRQAAETADEA
ncbi:phosphopantetheine-binding protein [Streptomyces sp. NPDC096132]|uniref:phosphopantetheine-binding protein n=1 Tax=Streptomyces sp. NPDC096132 TaxID=3366075 RepID=UPI0037F870E0